MLLETHHELDLGGLEFDPKAKPQSSPLWDVIPNSNLQDLPNIAPQSLGS